MIYEKTLKIAVRKTRLTVSSLCMPGIENPNIGLVPMQMQNPGSPMGNQFCLSTSAIEKYYNIKVYYFKDIFSKCAQAHKIPLLTTVT